MPPKAGAYRPPVKGASTSKKSTSSKPSNGAARSAGRYVVEEASDGGEEEEEDEEVDEDEELSVVDPEEDEEDDSEEEYDSYDSDEDAEDFRSGGVGRNAADANSRKRKFPSEKVQKKKWRKLSVEEREAVTSEGGIVWREARALIAGLPKAAQQLVSAALFKALARADQQLEKTLVPREPRMPAMMGTGAGGRSMASGASTTASGVGGEVTSSMISWRVEELGELSNGGLGGMPDEEGTGAGFGGDIADLEAMLLPEAEQAVELSRALDEQDAALRKTRSRLARLRKETGLGDATEERIQGRADIGKLAALLRRVREPNSTPQDELPSTDV